MWISQQVGEKFQKAWSMVNLGFVFLRLGEDNRARKIFFDCLKMFEEGDDMSGVIYSIEGLASLAHNQGQPDIAIQLYGWADANRLTSHDKRPTIEQIDIDRELADIKDLLGEEAYQNAYSIGQSITIEQVIELANTIEIIEN